MIEASDRSAWLRTPRKTGRCRARRRRLRLALLLDFRPLFRGKTQLQLEAHAAQDVARAVANRDRVVRAIIE